MVVIGVLIIQNNVSHYYTIGNLPYVSRRHVYEDRHKGVCTYFYLLQLTGAMGFHNRGLCVPIIYNISIQLTNIGNQRPAFT